MSCIVLTGGGTAGHCIPNVALLDDLKHYYNEIYYIGSENGIEKTVAEANGLTYFPITTCKLVRKKILKNLSIPQKLLKSVKQCKKILNTLRPDVVFSKGGYVGLPVAMACKKLGVPLVIHESDLSIGLANKLSSSCADKVLTTFPQTAKTVRNGVYVGSPIRKQLLIKETDTKMFPAGKPVLLFIGGSSGSTSLNSALKDSINALLPIFNVIHITGKDNTPICDCDGYKAIKYADDMQKILSITDIAVSRAGSNSLCELILCKIPTLFIPLPKGNSRGDQVENATYVYKNGLCNVLMQENLTTQSLFNEITATYSNRFNLKRNLSSQEIITIGNDSIIDILSKYAKQ